VAHLELVGHPCAVAPDAGLRRAARRRGWRTWEETDGSRGPDRQGTRG
jgi:phosphoserine phosphatase